MDAFVSYSYGTAAWLALQATPLIISPSIIVTILSPEVHQTTPLEAYFSRSLGLSLLCLALLSLALAGFFTSSTPSSSTIPTTDPYAPAALTVTTIYHFSTTFYAYGQYVRTGQMSFMLGVVGSGAMAAMGVWCILFGAGSRISKRTGADKRTSGWPFGNVEADRKRVPKKVR